MNNQEEARVEAQRAALQHGINNYAASKEEQELRSKLEEKFGEDNVWNTEEVTEVFVIDGFLAPFCSATRREDRVKGVLTFTHSPRFYFDFIPS